MKIELYTKPLCPYCVRAKALLEAKKACFVEYNISNPSIKEEMLQRTKGAQTVPQIFIDNELIGGCDELFALEMSGKLNQLLSSHPCPNHG